MQPSSLAFQMFQPTDGLADFIQAVWCASVPKDKDTFQDWLPGDACCGVLFNLASDIKLDYQTFAKGIICQAVSKEAHHVCLPAGAQLVGIRFQPGIAPMVLGKLYVKTTQLNIADDVALRLQQLFQRLQNVGDANKRIETVLRWLNRSIGFSSQLPKPLSKAIASTANFDSLDALNDTIPLSQRQLERQFRHWLDMTPKYFQRIVRVKAALKAIKEDPDVVFSNLACRHGFSDQSHMTREFQLMAHVSPKQYRQRAKGAVR